MEPDAQLHVIEIKAFVPARDFALSKRFYLDMGFTLASDAAGIAYFHHGGASFLLQDFHQPAHAAHFMMHLLVDSADAWWQRLDACGIAPRYGVRLGPVQQQPWFMRDFVLGDPSGVLWRIAQNTPRTSGASGESVVPPNAVA